jgi:hypothetical protein
MNGNALETSVNVEFTVDATSGKRMPGPRVESATHLMATGLDGSLDVADGFSLPRSWVRQSKGDPSGEPTLTPGG